jgi:hypothetical protein
MNLLLLDQRMLQIKKLIVRIRMLYAKVRGHKGKRWNYEPSKNYMRKKHQNDKRR